MFSLTEQHWVRESLPSASITFDRFHVAKVQTDAVDRVRQPERRMDRTVKGARFALHKNPENLTDHWRKALQESPHGMPSSPRPTG
jgi:transposase